MDTIEWTQLTPETNKCQQPLKREVRNFACKVHVVLAWCLTIVQVNIWAYMRMNFFPALPFSIQLAGSPSRGIRLMRK
ncbi:hypothetical protein T4D_14819 [Trichinella pseudospiralis]|uniref:Uncharacterized protein n=1 Tax=Trichinella pseudospiralis TaxID=6337 RepID=A0A0V1FKR1_TRIPS|nr:hypothetical protein T4D_14819 [Trichinella pseudospiralis]